MQQLIEALTINPHYLKACILYEVLQKKPVFDSYRSFCKTIGDGVMDYVDFEYWFFGFYSGNCDFDHDGSHEPKQKALVELPVEILSKIAKEVDPKERVLFSTMSKAIKRICDIHHRPQFQKVNVSASSNHYHLVVDRKTRQYSSDVNNFLFKGLAVSKQAFHIPKLKIEHLTLDWEVYGYKIANIIPHGLHVKYIEINTQQPNAIVKVLERFQPGTLEKIKLDSLMKPVYLSSILSLRQFKEAKEVDFKSFGEVKRIEHLRRFSHLEKFEVTFDMITPEIAIGIRDMLSASKVFKSCVIKCIIYNVAALGQALGANIPGDVQSVIHRTHIQGTRDFLEFNIEKFKIRVVKKQFEL